MPRYKSPNGIGRVGRDKKKKALESDEYKENIESLAQRGVTSEDIEMIYNKCQERPQTKLAKHTLASKLVELLEYFDERNEGLSEDDKGYISKEDSIEMIMRNPRIVTSSIANNIIAKCQIITEKRKSVRDANAIIKCNPGVFRKSIETIEKDR